MEELKKEMKIKNAVWAFRNGHINIFEYFDLVRHLLTIILVFNVMGCAKDSDSNSTPIPAVNPLVSCAELAGTYDNAYVGGSVLVLTNYCNLTESSCGYVGSFTQPNRSTGDTIFTVDVTNGSPGCMSSTPHNCKIELKGFQLGVACDGTTESAVFIKRL